jgi:iron complex outermembrane recepter protein
LKNKAINLRKQLLLFTACTMVSGALAARAHAQSAPTMVTPTPVGPTAVTPTPVGPTGVTPTPVGPAGATPVSANAAATPMVVNGKLSAYEIQKVRILYQKLLLRAKDVPSAVTDLDAKDIKAQNPTMGSVQTLLKQSPSVQAYSQGPGQSAPTLAIRGVRNDELAETLDGIPINDLASGSGDYLSNDVGSAITLNELGGTTVYPGVAPPDQQGFGTVGGTIAYQTLQPTDKRYEELEGGFGSFDTQHFGFTINTGKIGDGVDAPKAIILYDQSQTAGYVSNTPAQYHDFLFNLQKPYDNGLSKVGLVVIFNQGKGTIQTVPTPTALISDNKYTYNFPRSLGYFNQAGQFLTTILSDETYINPHLIFNGSLFYLHSTDTVNSYASAETTNGSYPYQTNAQAPYAFFGPIMPGTYNPLDFGSYEQGEAYEEENAASNTIGITPKLNIFLPHNTITIGGLLAKESGDSGPSFGSEYIYGSPNGPEINGYNSLTYGGGEQRSVYVGYLDDKIDLLNNHLHIEPGLAVNAAYSSNIEQELNGRFDPVKLQNFSKVGEPYLGISYDLPDHLTAYATYGKSSLDAPVQDYSVGTTSISGVPESTQAPSPEIVNLYEAGLRYDTPRLYLSGDYFYQKVDDAFSFYNNYLTNTQYYANTGAYLARGVELAAKYRVTPTISVEANGSWNNTDYLNNYFAFVTLQEDQFGYAMQGTPISNVPKFLGNIAVDYDKGPFFARLSGQYTGQEYETYDILTPSNPGSALSGATTTNVNALNPSNFLLNFVASYKLPVYTPKLQSLTLTFTALNFLNVHYYNYQYASELPSGGVYSILPEYQSGLIGPPASFELDLRARF